MTLMSISRIISHHAAKGPQRPAVTYEGHTMTWQELDRATNRLARAYQQLGVQQNDFVTVALPNSIEFIECCFALWKLGATPQPVSFRLPQMELKTIVALANSSLVVGVDPLQLKDRPVLPAGFQPDPQLSDVQLPDVVPRYFKAPTSGGSTGRPKLIVSTGPGAFDLEKPGLFGIFPSSTQLIPGPLYHNAPFISAMSGLFRGSHVVVMSRFDPEESLQLLDKYQVAYVMLVPTMMHRIWQLGEAVHQKYDLSSLRMMIHTAAPCPVWLKENWIAWLGDRVYEMYGGTEGTGLTWITSEEWLQHKGSVGKLISEGQIKIVDDEGQELPPRESGEIYFLPAGGQGSTYHYIGAEAKSIEGGWETLGDIGYLDEEGYLYLKDRRKDMILYGGANVYPAEVEAAIDSHPAVRSSAVVGLPDEEYGHLVHAIVDAPEGLTEEALLVHLALRLVPYKLPRSFEFVHTPLRDDAGKTRRSALLQEPLRD